MPDEEKEYNVTVVLSNAFVAFVLSVPAGFLLGLFLHWLVNK